MTQITDLLAQIDTVRYNPSGIQRKILNVLDEVMGGTRPVVDPSNPFVFALETSAVNAAATMIENETLARKQYANMALTEDELYMHMSDRDYVNRFATPSRGTFTLLLEKEEVYTRALATGTGKVRKLVIPRNTEITVSGYVFTMQYPIEIRVMGHGGLQIVYDVTRPSPLQTLASNVVDWSIVHYDRTAFIRLNIPVQQFEIQTKFASLNSAQIFSKTYDLNDSFCYCRVYESMADGSWSEIATTHTDQVFDPTVPTALLQVYQNTLKVSIPQVYFSTQLLTKELRIDIYTTRGALDLNLIDYPPNSYRARWVDLENDDAGIYSAPLGVFTTYSLFNDGVVSGGRGSLSFEDLRQRVLTNALGNNQLPITNVQVTSLLNDRGYQSVVNVDNITNRVFLATRKLPAPSNRSVSAGAGCCIRTLETSLTYLETQSTVRYNGPRMTVLPTTLYEDQGGRIAIVPDVAVAQILQGTLEEVANNVNDHRYLYSPFHYVLDSTDQAFESRGYYLGNPQIQAKVFVEENDSLGMELTAANYELKKVDNGFLLTVVTKSGATVQALRDDQVYAQLHFKPLGESDRAYMNGTLAYSVDGERVYEFLLETNYDLTNDDALALTSFIMYNNEPRTYYTPLGSDFELIFGVSGVVVPEATSSNIDVIQGNALLPAGAQGVVHERLVMHFGDALKGLWSNSRSVVSSIRYEKYDVNIPSTYKENVYLRDAVTGELVWTMVDGRLSTTLLHAKGDPVLDTEGATVFKNRAGDPRLDPATNQPIVANPRGMLRQVDLFLVDGDYYFATEAQALEYRAQVPQTIVGWLNDDIAGISDILLEQSNLYFYPQATLGTVETIIKEGATMNLEAEQALKVRYYLTKAGYANADLLKALTSMTITTVAECFGQSIVTVDGLEAKLRAQAGDDVIALGVEGLGGSLNLLAVTLKDDSARLAIRKRLTPQPEGTLIVQDDVDVIFVRHEPLA